MSDHTQKDWLDAMVAKGHVPEDGLQCKVCRNSWFMTGYAGPELIAECSERAKAEAPLIKNRYLAKLSGVPSGRIRDWRRHGYVPKEKWIPAWWANVVTDVAKTETCLPKLFENAVKWNKPSVEPRDGREPVKQEMAT